MKRLFILLLMATVLSVRASAEDEVKMYSHVTLMLHDGSKYDIPIEHGSQIYSYVRGTGTNTYFVVDVTGKDCYYLFRREEIASMKMTEDAEHVDIDTPTIEDDVHASKLHYRKGELLVHQTLDGTQLTIVDLCGRVVYTTRVESPFALHLGFLPEGVYVAKVNEYTLKIRR